MASPDPKLRSPRLGAQSVAVIRTQGLSDGRVSGCRVSRSARLQLRECDTVANEGCTMEPEMLAYYDQGREQVRLEAGRLELIRTQELLHRFMPPPPARIVDIGGGAGIHALPLIGEGYLLDLVDPVPLHIDQAREAGVASATVGEARALSFDDESVDVVLLLGPLYHLTEREDRLAALREARRVTLPGGLLFAAAISRFASTHDGLQLQFLDEPEFERIVEDDVATGRHRNPTNRRGWFTTAYMHRPEEIGPELVDAGWEPRAILGIEGPGSSADSAYWLQSPERQEILLRAIRRVEAEPSLLGSSPHILAVATRTWVARRQNRHSSRPALGNTGTD